MATPLTKKACRRTRGLQLRAAAILDREIPFIYNRRLEKLSEVDVAIPEPALLFRDATPADSSEPGKGGRLLTPAGEQLLFKRLNYLRFRANQLRSRLSRSRPSAKALDEIERLLALATEARNLLAECNLRLVAKLARKVGRSDEFEDFQSEGHCILLSSIDKFDVFRGFRFSTYATHAVQRRMYRLLKSRSARRLRETCMPTGFLCDALESPAPEIEREPLDPGLLARVRRLLDQRLDPRELAILRARFGLGGVEGEASYRVIASKLGLSKERVRQLQNRALSKLHALLASSVYGRDFAMG